MRKFIFYAKLALGNLWRNRRTYLPYLLACIVSIFTFYTMLAINTNGALDGIRGEEIVKSFTALGSWVLAIFCSILIFYTNSFLIKRRKKELGLYSILGMEKKNIGILMLYETVFVAVIALLAGLGLGLLLNQLLFWTLLRMLRYPVMMDMPASPAALASTAAFFGALFLLTLLSNLRQVHIANPINLLAGAKQGEKEPKASWVLTVMGLLLLAGGYFIAFYFRSPVEALLLFLVAAILVILGTYCLFTSGSIALLKLLRSRKSYYYQPGRFITVSGMIYRMKQNAAGLASICVLSCMVLVTVSGTVSLNVGVEDSLLNQYPYAYDLRFTAAQDADTLLAGAQAVAEQSGVTLVHVQDYTKSTFMAAEGDGGFALGSNADSSVSPTYIHLLTLEEYNRNEAEHAVLDEGEALILVTGGRYGRDTLALGGVSYRLRPLERLGKTTAGSRDVGRTLTLVLPGEAARQTILASIPGGYTSARTLTFDVEGEEASKILFEEGFAAWMSTISTQEHFSCRSREENRQDWYASNGGFLFLGLYFGILFMLAAALIIYYKQVSEGYDDAERFEILQKVGMGEEEVKKAINQQILAVFFLPLLVAIVHVAVAFFPISRGMVIFGVLNTPLLILSSVVTVLVYAIIYLLVFRQTARAYFGIVRRKATA